MADKRMLSVQIIESDAFLALPLSAQALYVHLNLAADDEGFVNGARRIARSVGATMKDLQTLIDARFILEFDSGAVVIKHWHINNKLRRDRLRPTTYTEDRKTLEIKENGAYTVRHLPDNCRTSAGHLPDICRTNDGQLTDICPTNDGQMTDNCRTFDGQLPDKCPPNIREDKISKDNISEDKVSKDNNNNIVRQGKNNLGNVSKYIGADGHLTAEGKARMQKGK